MNPFEKALKRIEDLETKITNIERSAVFADKEQGWSIREIAERNALTQSQVRDYLREFTPLRGRNRG